MPTEVAWRLCFSIASISPHDPQEDGRTCNIVCFGKESQGNYTLVLKTLSSETFLQLTSVVTWLEFMGTGDSPVWPLLCSDV